MAELLDNLLSTQDRMRPYIERYRTLMSTDPALTATVNKSFLIVFTILNFC